MAAKFEISKDHAGKFRFHLKAPEWRGGKHRPARDADEGERREGVLASSRGRPAPRSKTAAEHDQLDAYRVSAAWSS